MSQSVFPGGMGLHPFAGPINLSDTFVKQFENLIHPLWANIQNKPGWIESGLSAADIATGNLAYARLPVGAGTWATGGNLIISGGTISHPDAQGPNSWGGAVHSRVQHYFTGSFSGGLGGSTYGINYDSFITPPTTNAGYGVSVDGRYVTNPATTHTEFANLRVRYPQITLTAGGAVTTTFSLVIERASTVGITNWALWVGPGNSYFDGPLGLGVSPTARLHLGAGTAAAQSAPLKLTSGVLNTTPEVGALEFLTDALYFTVTTAAARKTIAFIDTSAFTAASVSFANAVGQNSWGVAPSTRIQHSFGGSFVGGTGGTTFGLRYAGTLTPAVANAAHGLSIQPFYNANNGQVHSLFAGAHFTAPSITLNGGTVTEATTVYIVGAPTAGVTNWALNIAAGNVYLSTGYIQFGEALVALGGGAAPTLGTIGGAGPTVAAQNSWKRFKDSTGADFWVPAWK